MQELKRRMTSAKAWGVEPVSLLTPAEVKELVPFLDETVILGAFYSPGVGVVDSLRAGTLMREQAIEQGALTVSANTEVLDIETARRTSHRSEDDRGRHRDGGRRHRLRRLEPEARADGGARASR